MGSILWTPHSFCLLTEPLLFSAPCSTDSFLLAPDGRSFSPHEFIPPLASAIYNSDRLFPFLPRPNSIGFCREIPGLLRQEENWASPTWYMPTSRTWGSKPCFPPLLSTGFKNVSKTLRGYWDIYSFFSSAPSFSMVQNTHLKNEERQMEWV